MDNNLILTDSEIENLEKYLIRETTHFVEGLAKEGERAAVVLGAARLDISLKHILKKLMHPPSGGSDNLFDSSHALSTFSAKIALAYRLGVIDKNFEHALQMIRKIRNAFAHSIGVASLSEAPYNGQLAELIRDIKKDGDTFDDMVSSLKDAGFPEKSLSFCSAIIVLLVKLEIVAAATTKLELGSIARLDETRFHEQV